jgi:hypothetical protein
MRSSFVGRDCPVLTLVLVVLTMGLAGCGSGHAKTHRAGGKVIFRDGSPMPGGKIEFSPIGEVKSESGKLPPNPAAVIDKDGTFRLTTYKPFDGALPGRYRVIVQELRYEAKFGQPPSKPTIDPKYTDYDTSGLQAEIKEGANDLTITISRQERK